MTELRGVGPERAAQLNRLGLATVQDLLLLRPRRHEDRREFRHVAQLERGQCAAVQGTITALGVKRWRHGSRSRFEFVLEDGTGRLHCRWWNLPYLEDHFHVGEAWVVFGKVIDLRPRTMDHPETEPAETGDENSIHLGRIVPVYPLTEGLSQRWLRALVWRTLLEPRWQIPDPYPGFTPPGGLSRSDAIRRLHFPENPDDLERCRQRLALDELRELQLEIQRRRRRLCAVAPGLPCAGDNRLIRPLLQRLGFKLTEAQTRVLRQIRKELAGPHPMRRLLQGDVGCGKTVVAVCTALMACESGYNVLFMAPTEILADQHFRTLQRWCGGFDLGIHLHTGSQKTRPDNGATGGPQIVVGTHALIQEPFTVERLGLVIIDEQHRFGVAEREKLVRKGAYPHLLVMTATPIPRTLGLTLYGDLDLSVIDELPPGRGRVRTFVRTRDGLPKVWAFVRQQLAAGRQAYVIYPRIEETGPSDLKAVMAEHESLVATFAPHRVGVVHGRMPAAEKDAVMRDFRAKDLALLLATSVLEVGVDVPNATVMIVENAELFGLAQLHQLRGRIGRGAQESYCVLVASAKTPEARRRLKVMEETHDGFRIAEEDFKLRGPGEFLGREQSGRPAFRFVDLTRDLGLVEQARGQAHEILEGADRGQGEG